MSYSLWTTPKKFGINLPIRASVNPFISSSSPRLSQKKNVYSFMTFFPAFEEREHRPNQFCYGTPLFRVSLFIFRFHFEKSPYFTFVQINISFKISVALLRNLCGNLNEKFVSDQSSGLKEMSQGCIWMRCCLDKILSFLVQQVTFPPLQRASLSREGLGYNWKQSMRSNRSRLQQVADNVLVPFIRTLSRPR